MRRVACGANGNSTASSVNSARGAALLRHGVHGDLGGALHLAGGVAHRLRQAFARGVLLLTQLAGAAFAALLLAAQQDLGLVGLAPAPLAARLPALQPLALFAQCPLFAQAFLLALFQQRLRPGCCCAFCAA